MRRAITPTRALFAGLGLAVVALALGGEPARLALRFERAALPVAEPWRWLSAHLVHLGPRHALLNLAGLALVGLLFEKRLSAPGWAMAATAAAAAIGAGLWFATPELAWYVGLSGVLHGLFAAGALAEWRDGRRSGLWLLVGLALKLAWEQTLGALPLTASASGGPVVVDAHLYGTLGALAAYGLMRSVGRASRP